MKLPVLPLFISCALLTACQPQQNQASTHPTEKQADVANEPKGITLIQAQTKVLNLTKPEVCEAATSTEDFAMCTKYHLQTINTNVDWLNQYFTQRLKTDYAEAFDASPAVNVTLDPEIPSTNYTTASVRYIGQHDYLAGFEYFTDHFPAGAAHGTHFSEYIVFDLKTKQRLSLNDILLPASKEQLKAELYAYNSQWLEEHHIAEHELDISDNFYYGANGIVFVYPLYELASYAEGLTELELPYWAAQELIKAEYLPQLPTSSEEIYQ